MRFTLLPHAGLWVEHGGTAVLVDPWLLGDCYGRGWAMLCESAEWVSQLPRPHAVLYSHAHPDHFHAPTLRALAAHFGSDLPIVIPRLLVRRLAMALRDLGFRNVREAPAARAVRLGEGFDVTFHPVRADDHLQVFRDGASTLVNANDCQLDGRVLDQLARRYAGADFYLGQYSIGDAYPFRLQGVDDEVLRHATAAPAERFRRQARAFGARRAVPTAGGFRFAHADNQDLNRWCTTLDELDATDFPELEVLYPGDGWDGGGPVREGLHRDAYQRAVASMRDGSAPCVPRQPAPAVSVIESAAAERFSHMFDSIPALLRRHMEPLGFHLEDLGRSLTVDWGGAAIRWGDGLPDTPHYRLAAEHFAGVCRSPQGWSTLHVGGRFRVHGAHLGSAVQTFLPISLVYALGYFDRRGLSHLRPRLLQTVWARRVELIDLLPRLGKLRRSGQGVFRRL